jgi:hypothetical protein
MRLQLLDRTRQESERWSIWKSKETLNDCELQLFGPMEEKFGWKTLQMASAFGNVIYVI